MQTNQIDTPGKIDPSWPQFDPDTMKHYGGKWVVVFDGRIVAASDDPRDARQQAATVLGMSADELTAIAISSPDAFFV